MIFLSIFLVSVVLDFRAILTYLLKTTDSEKLHAYGSWVQLGSKLKFVTFLLLSQIIFSSVSHVSIRKKVVVTDLVLLKTFPKAPLCLDTPKTDNFSLVYFKQS